MLRGLRVSLLLAGGAGLGWCIGLNAVSLIRMFLYASSLRWVHPTHSMKQAFDVLRQLRACGLPVHAWP